MDNQTNQPSTHTPTDLATDWLQAKAAEEAAREARIRIEDEMIQALGCRDEGSQTHDADGYKITITGKINRTLDRAAWESIASKVPEDLRPVEYKPSLDLKGLRYLQDHNPDVYRVVAEAVTAKPGKASITVKEAK